jgi:hypothetical protein
MRCNRLDRSEMAEHGRSAKQRDFAMSLEVAAPHFANCLPVAEGVPVDSRGFIRYADDDERARIVRAACIEQVLARHQR